MTFATLAVTSDRDVLSITLNAPATLNAVSTRMADEIVEALNTRGDARAVLLTGAGRAFCSGANLQHTPDASVDSGAACEIAMERHFNPMIAAIADLPVPVVVAVNGAAAGIGCSLALAGDIVVAARSAYFLQAFVSVGLVPDGGASWLLPRIVGRARASAMLMLGEKVGAQQAEDWGLIHRCVPEQDLAAAAFEFARRLAGGPTVALGLIRRNIHIGSHQTLADSLACEARAQRVAVSSQDAAEGVRAFVEKRPPVFVGR